MLKFLKNYQIALRIKNTQQNNLKRKNKANILKPKKKKKDQFITIKNQIRTKSKPISVHNKAKDSHLNTIINPIQNPQMRYKTLTQIKYT